MSQKTISLPFSPDEVRMGVRIGETYELLVPGPEIGVAEARVGDLVTVTAIRGNSILGTIPGVVAECGDDWEFEREWLGPKKAAGKVMSNQKATPRPWGWKKNTGGQSQKLVEIFEGTDRVAVMNWTTGSPEKNASRAALIVEAVNSHDALKEKLQKAERQHTSDEQRLCDTEDERDALKAQNAELVEALRELIGAAGALESADSEDGDASRTLTKPLKRARAALTKAGVK